MKKKNIKKRTYNNIKKICLHIQNLMNLNNFNKTAFKQVTYKVN